MGTLGLIGTCGMLGPVGTLKPIGTLGPFGSLGPAGTTETVGTAGTTRTTGTAGTLWESRTRGEVAFTGLLEGKTVQSFVASGIQSNLCLKIAQRTGEVGRFNMASISELSCSKVPFLLTSLLFVTSLFTCETIELSEAELKFIDDLIQGYEKSKVKCIQQVFGLNPSVDGSHLRLVTLWDPLGQIKCEGLLVCQQCQSPLRPWRWKSASTKRQGAFTVYRKRSFWFLVFTHVKAWLVHHNFIPSHR